LHDDDAPRQVRVAFILNQHNAELKSRGVLFSIHDEDVPVFRLLRMRARRAPGLIEDAKEVLLKLFDADAEYSADTLEGIYDELEKAGTLVLSGDVTDAMAGEVLGAIARQEDMNGRIRRNMMDTRRAVSFMMRSKMLNAEQFEDARQLLRDIDSLDSHTAFLFDKINFLMDATVGFININQNKIIKIFSVASVALLPPTLIASIYGMNFQHMPELAQSWGYPYALVLMVASALVPMWYFRRRGWLKPGNQPVIGILGGSGVYDIDGLDNNDGSPSTRRLAPLRMPCCSATWADNRWSSCPAMAAATGYRRAKSTSAPTSMRSSARASPTSSRSARWVRCVRRWPPAPSCWSTSSSTGPLRARRVFSPPAWWPMCRWRTRCAHAWAAIWSWPHGPRAFPSCAVAPTW
jgi:magnesium transporter